MSVTKIKATLFSILAAALVVLAVAPARADVISWQGPSHVLTIGVSEDDITQVEFPEEIVSITVENPDYLSTLVVEGYHNKAFRMRSMLPKMATRVFMTSASQRTYILVVTTDVPYRALVQIADGTKVNAVAEEMGKKFNMNDMIRAMAQDKDLPGILRETHIIPNWFEGGGLSFELTEVWQTPLLTGLVVHVKNTYDRANEVNIPAITIPKTTEWGVLRKAAMENMRLAPMGRPNDRGVMYLVFAR